MNETQIKTKKCPYCNKVISGRADKVFCDDKCRNNFYYQVNYEQKAFIRSVNGILMKNRGILRSLNSHGKTSVPKSYLEQQGFDFRYFTETYRTKRGQEYYVVYDQAYSIGEEDRVSLVVFYHDMQSVVC